MIRAKMFKGFVYTNWFDKRKLCNEIHNFDVKKKTAKVMDDILFLLINICQLARIYGFWLNRNKNRNCLQYLNEMHF